MRDIDLNQFWPQYAPAPARRAVSLADAPVIEGQPLAPGSAPREPLAAGASAFDHEAAIKEALAAASSGRALASDEIAPPQLTPSMMDAEAAALEPPAGASHPQLAAPVLPPPPLAQAAAAAPRARSETTTVPADARDSQILPQPRRRDFTPLVWGGAGFIAGAVVWHTVGFWMFLSDVVLNANDPRAPTALEALLPNLPASAPGQKAMSRIPESAVIPTAAAFKNAAAGTQFACVALALDRAAGITNAKTCKGSPADLRDAGFNRRSDRLALRPRLQDPVAWTGTTAVQVSEAAAEPAPASAAGTDSADELPPLSDAELKLDLD